MMLSHCSVSFSVPFVHGQHRPRWGKGHMRQDPSDVDAEKTIWNAYAGASVRAYGRIVSAPPKVGVRVEVRMWGVMPKGRPKRCGDAEGYVEKPDADNAIKSILDALNPKTTKDPRTGAVVELRAGAWADDKQVVRIDAAKVARLRGGEERTDVVVEWPYGKDGN